MFRSISCTRYKFAARGGCRTLISVHRTFPATLYRFQLQRESRLYDKKLQEDDQDFNDAIEVSKDGLVRPGIIGDGAQNISFPTFLPVDSRIGWTRPSVVFG